MNRLVSLIVFLGVMFASSAAMAGGGGGSSAPKFAWKDSGATQAADLFAQAVAKGNYKQAYEMGGAVLREKRTLKEFKADMQRWGFDAPGSVEWT